jgi:uridine kinase
MKRPYVIAINAVSGGGKTAVAKLLVSSLPKAALFCFDDFDDSNVYPDDFCEWTMRGADLLKFDCPGMAAAVEDAISSESAEYIVLDYPFGRDHPRFQNRIDLSVFVDTPLDVAMARRILRDTRGEPDTPAGEVLRRLREELDYYIRKARYAYMDTYRHRDTSDLVLDGWTSLEQLRDQIVARIKAEPGGRPNAGKRPAENCSQSARHRSP